MIINKLVFPIKADLSFVEGGIPQGKLTANSINRDILYVISPAVKATVITAFFQNQKQTEDTQQATFVLSDLSIDYLVSKDTSYYELVKDWNVWQTTIPSKALEFISYNRAGKIGISFAFRQLLEPSGYEGSQEIKSDDFVIHDSGSYIIKIPYYSFLGIDFTYNDVLIYNGGTEVYKKPAIALQGTTGTLEYSVDPSVYMGGYEVIEISLTESILSKLQSLEADSDNEIIRVEQRIDVHIQDLDNPHNVKADQVEYVPNENVKEAIDRSAKVDEENFFTERQEFTRGIHTGTIEMDSDARIVGLGDGVYEDEAVNKSQLDRKVDNTLQEAKDYTYSQVEIDNKDTAVLTEAKEYTDDKISGVLRPSGNWNANTNTPTLANNEPSNEGKVYYVTNAGTQFGLTFAIGDKLAFIEGGVATKWDNVDDVTSVNGKVGTVVINADDIPFDGSGTNYLTDKTEVESAVKELDTQVKTNADNVALKVNTSDIVNDLVSTDVDKPLSANQGKVLNDTTAKLAVSNVFTQPQQVPNATLPQHTTNLSQVETMFEMFKRELRGYNLAMPDLTDKEYLGDGVYNLG